MARLPTPGGDQGNWGDILNTFLQTAHKADGSIADNAVGAAALADNAVTSAALGDNSVTTANIQAGAIVDASISASAAISQSKITNLSSDLAAKAASNHTHAVDDLSDAAVSGAIDGQSLVYQSGTWVPATVTSGGGVTDHGALTGLTDDDHSQYHTDARGDARYYTQSQVNTSLSAKANTSHTHTTTDITGLSGSLAAKADDSAVVHDSGDETVAGIKTFSSAPVVPDASFTIAKTTGLQAALDTKFEVVTYETGDTPPTGLPNNTLILQLEP